MLEEQVVDAFLNNIKKEADLYLPFMAMLRAQGYRKVHLLAGHYEHGKDIIAQRTDSDGRIVQYVFPIKKDNLDQDKWAKLRAQLNECVDYNYAHADFDGMATRQIIIVFSGEAVGKVGEWIQNFNENTAPKLGIPPVILWGRDRLKEMFRSEDCLTKVNWVEIASFLEKVTTGAGFGYIEANTQSWAIGIMNAEGLWARGVELGFLWAFLRGKNLRLHASQLTLCLLRAVMSAEDEQRVSAYDASALVHFVKDALCADSKEFLVWFSTLPNDQRIRALIRFTGTELVEFSCRTLLILQTISLSIINGSLSLKETTVARELMELCLGIEAIGKPISDNFAPTIIVIATAAKILGIDVQPWLKRIAIWVCNSHADDSPGLALSGSNEQEEIWRTCGAPIDNALYPKISNSMLAAAILDLCSIFSFADLYNDVMADLNTLRINPIRKIPDKYSDELFSNKQACYVPPHQDYSISWLGDEGWINSGAHRKADSIRPFNDGERDWIGLALSLVLRDRWWLHSVRMVLHKSEAIPLPP
jgi:hypothetical protein